MLGYTIAVLLLQVGGQRAFGLESSLNLATLIHSDATDFLLPDFSCAKDCSSDFFGNLCYGSSSSSSCGQAANRCSLLLGFDVIPSMNLEDCALEYHNPSCSSGHCWGIITNTPGSRCSVEGHLFTCAGGTHCSISRSEASLEVCAGNINFNAFGTFTTAATSSACSSANQKNATSPDVHIEPVYHPGTILHI